MKTTKFKGTAQDVQCVLLYFFGLHSVLLICWQLRIEIMRGVKCVSRLQCCIFVNLT